MKYNQKATIRRLAGSLGLKFFAKIYFPHLFNLDFCSMHNDFFEILESDQTNKRFSIIAPRGHGKSSIFCLLYVLWCFCYKKKTFVLYISASETLVKQRIQNLIYEIEGNMLLYDDFKHLRPAKDKKSQFIKYADGMIVFEDGRIVFGISFEQNCRGLNVLNQRPDLVILDDAEDDLRLENDSYRDRLKSSLNRVILHLGGPSAPLDIYFIDTLRHPDSLALYAGTLPSFEMIKYSAADKIKKEVMWEAAFVFHVDDLKQEEVETFYQKQCRVPFYGELVNNKNEVIRGICESDKLSIRSVHMEYFSEILEDERYPLRKTLWTYFDYLSTHHFKRTVGALDLSAGKANSDFQCLTIVGVENNRYHLLDCVLSRYDFEQEKQINNIFELISITIINYKCSILCVEQNFQSLFVTYLRKYFKENGIPCRIATAWNTINKDSRIRYNLGSLIANGLLLFRSDCETQYPQAVDQICRYPDHPKDDAPDSIELCCRTISAHNLL